jgi:hypothetical protein
MGCAGRILSYIRLVRVGGHLRRLAIMRCLWKWWSMILGLVGRAHGGVVTIG